LLRQQVQDCQCISWTISSVAKTIDEINAAGLVDGGGFTEFHLSGLNRAIVFLIEYQNRQLEKIASLADEV
jgi:hypothetical protein